MNRVVDVYNRIVEVIAAPEAGGEIDVIIESNWAGSPTWIFLDRDKALELSELLREAAEKWDLQST